MTFFESAIWKYVTEGDYIPRSASKGTEHLRAYFHRYHDHLMDIYFKAAARVKGVDVSKPEDFQKFKDSFSITLEPSKQRRQEIQNAFRNDLKKVMKLDPIDAGNVADALNYYSGLGLEQGKTTGQTSREFRAKGELTPQMRARWKAGEEVFGRRAKPEPGTPPGREYPSGDVVGASGYSAIKKEPEEVLYDLGKIRGRGAEEEGAAIGHLGKYRKYAGGQFFPSMRSELERTRSSLEPGERTHPLISLRTRDPERYRGVQAHAYDWARYKDYISKMEPGKIPPSFERWRKSYREIPPEDYTLRGTRVPPPKEEPKAPPRDEPKAPPPPRDEPKVSTPKGESPIPPKGKFKYLKHVGVAAAGLTALALAARAYKKHKEKKEKDRQERAFQTELERLRRS